jgi:hypothetical protein
MYDAMLLDIHGCLTAPVANWFPVFPGAPGINLQDQLVKHRCFRGFQWACRMNVKSGIGKARKRVAGMFGAPRTNQSRPIRIS